MSETIATPPRRPKHMAEASLGRAIRASLIAHGAVILLIVFKSLVFPSKSKPYVPTLRVDMVALPDMLKKDLQNLPRAQSQSAKEIAEALKRAEADAKNIKRIKIPDLPKQVKQADPDEMVLKPKHATKTPEKDASKHKEKESPSDSRSDRLKSSLARIRALSKIQSEVSNAEAPRGAVIKGNKISKGSSLSGDAKEAAEASYYDDLRSKLQENWALPVWIARQNLSAQVQVYIDSRGRVRSYRFVKPSGNPQFDSAIKKTLEESQPFPRPPEEIASSLLVDGIRIGFPL